MDIKELQLLRDLSHDNIVRFVSDVCSAPCPIDEPRQYGVSVPENTKETPVMMISELCSNGDLFDYVRNEKAPSLSRVVGFLVSTLHYQADYSAAAPHVRHCQWLGIPAQTQAFYHSSRLQIVEHPDYPSRESQDRRFWARQSQAVNTFDGAKSCWHRQLASAGALERTSKIRPQGRRLFLCDGVLGDTPVASSKQKIPLGGHERACYI